MENVIILAAGKSTRMKSKKTKILHSILGKEIINYVVDLAENINANKKILVVSNEYSDLENLLKDRVEYSIQKEQTGTATAVSSSFEKLIYRGNTLILFGDVPLLSKETIDEFIKYHKEEKNALSVLSTIIEKPFSYGRIKRENNKFISIVEEIDASEEDKKIKEINTGVLIVDTIKMKEYFSGISNNNPKKEYYLTDLVKIFSEKNEKIGAYISDKSFECEGVNDRKKLIMVQNILKENINSLLQDNGVTIHDTNSTYIGPDVIIEEDVEIMPNTYIFGNSYISTGCIIGPNVSMENMNIGNNTIIKDSSLSFSSIGSNSTIGPYAYVRPDSNIGNNCKIGDFVEIKNSVVGDNTKVSHLTYIGDADVGKNINFGCGTVFVNYDGNKKHRSIIEDDSFIGCNVNIISPVKIGAGSYVAAATTVTEDIESGSLSIGRVRQENKPNWNKNK